VTSTDLVRPSRETFSILANLEAAGVIDEVSLTLTDPDLPFDTWLAILRALGVVDRASRWHIGDALNFGEALYGEISAQAVEATPSERYDEMQRITGMDRQTLMNIASICRRVAKSRRRRELGFWIHAEVAKLEPDEQVRWLEETVSKGWHRAELKQAIKNDGAPELDPVADAGEGDPPTDHRSRAERVVDAARDVWTQGQPTGRGTVEVPDTAWARLEEALGEER
jgi:hypothetical protein